MEHSQNLSPVRGPSVWSRDLTPMAGRAVPRAVLGGAGFGLIAAALMARRGAARSLLACMGVSLVAAAGAGVRLAELGCRIRAAIDRLRSVDRVTEASEESFPASDSPSWTPTTAGAPERARR